ncbi:hypothetical protein IKP13_08345 [bacterium]|nr:hypothetical protein [bacterium]
MFQWIKVLSKLSREDSILETMENRYAELTRKMQETDQRLKEAQEQYDKAEALLSSLNKRMEDDKAALEKIEAQMAQCDKQLQDKLLEIKNSAGKYLDEVNSKVQSCDSNISKVAEKMKELHEAVVDFQR